VTTMTKRNAYTLGPDVPDAEVLRDSKGRVLDDQYVEAAVDEAITAVRRRGRPSLSQSGESPLLRVRLSPELDDAVTYAAQQAGTSRAEWVRHALDEAVRRAG
jgi:predicted HicB family RNase H-like nuclease